MAAADEGGSVRDKDAADHTQEKATAASSLLGSFGEPQEKVVPSESDFLAILSTASTAENVVTSENLKRVQKEAQLQGPRKGRTKEMGRSGKLETKKVSGKSGPQYSQDSDGGSESRPNLGPLRAPPLSQHASGLLVSHGTTENVSQSLVLPKKEATPTKANAEQELKRKKKKRRRIVISDDEGEDVGCRSSSLTEDEPIDVVGTGTVVNPFKPEQKSRRFPESLSPTHEGAGEATSLVLHLDRHYCMASTAEREPLVEEQASLSSTTSFQTEPSASVRVAIRTLSRSSPEREEEGEREGEKRTKRKKKEKKRKKKRRHESVERPLGAGRDKRGTEPLKLKITIGDPDANTSA